MSTVAAEKRYTPEDLLKMPDGDRYELVDGELVEKHMGWNSGWTGGRLYHFLSTYCDSYRGSPRQWRASRSRSRSRARIRPWFAGNSTRRCGRS